MTAGEAFPDDAIADFSIQAELDVREMGLANHEAVELTVRVWWMGFGGCSGICWASILSCADVPQTES